MNLDPKQILLNPDNFNNSMINRGENMSAALVTDAYTSWKSANMELENLAARLNKISKSFNLNQGPDQAVQIKEQTKELNEHRKSLEKIATEKREILDNILDRLPNLLDTAVPVGKSDEDNVVLEYCGTKPEIENPLHHEDIAIKLGLWSRNEAVQMSGSRFICLKDKLAKLERILIQFALDENTKAGFIEMSMPFIVKRSSMYNTGQLPKFTEDYFAFDDYALIPTGEIPLINYYANKTLDESDLPIMLTTHTPCFRKEAGSLGKDTKGLIRLHQFHKVELVCITRPNDSEAMHFMMLEHVKNLLSLLGLHYRVVEVCSGDIGFTAARQFDIEVWMPGQGKYVEVISCSNCRDFQARRMKTKYTASPDTISLDDSLNNLSDNSFNPTTPVHTRETSGSGNTSSNYGSSLNNSRSNNSGSGGFVHTLNCTALACGRITAAILENYCFNNEFTLPDILYGYWNR